MLVDAITKVPGTQNKDDFWSRQIPLHMRRWERLTMHSDCAWGGSRARHDNKHHTDIDLQRFSWFFHHGCHLMWTYGPYFHGVSYGFPGWNIYKVYKLNRRKLTPTVLNFCNFCHIIVLFIVTTAMISSRKFKICLILKKYKKYMLHWKGFQTYTKLT